MKKNKTVLQRVKDLRDNNPDLVKILEDRFPEIVCKTPYIFPNTLFMKKANKNTLYLLEYIDQKFKIKNLKHNKEWMNTQANSSDCILDDAFLTMRDFSNLLSRGGTKIEDIRIVNEDILDLVYRHIF